MAYTRNSRLLKERMRGKWLNAFSQLAGDSLEVAIKKVGENVTCPLDGDKEGFRLLADADQTGGSAKQNLNEVWPDGITTLMNVTGSGFVEVFDMLSEWLDGSLKKDSTLYTADHVVKPKQTKVKDESYLKEWLNRLWKESISLNDDRTTIGCHYLESRFILDAALKSNDLKFHPSLKFTHDKQTLGYFPGLTAIVRDNSGKPVSIHRTYLDKNGKKLFLPQTKATRKNAPSLGKTLGRVVQLNQPENGILGIAEGLETALSITQASGIPVWSCISASMMPQFVPPEGVHTVIIFVDVDRSVAGEKAAHKLTESLEDKGIRVISLTPLIQRAEDQKSVDWADQLISDLETGSKAMLALKHYYEGLQTQGRLSTD